MNFSNVAFDLADRRAEQEREAGIRDAQAAVAGTGTMFCIDCTTPIDDRRRKVAPFAERCIDCQRIHENASRRCA